MINRSLHERIIVARAISTVTEESISKSIEYVKVKKDEKEDDYLWLKEHGDSLDKEDKLMPIVFHITGIGVPSPGKNPFDIEEEFLDKYDTYKFWYENCWIPYLKILLKRYNNIFESNLGYSLLLKVKLKYNY